MKADPQLEEQVGSGNNVVVTLQPSLKLGLEAAAMGLTTALASMDELAGVKSILLKAWFTFEKEFVIGFETDELALSLLLHAAKAKPATSVAIVIFVFIFPPWKRVDFFWFFVGILS